MNDLNIIIDTYLRGNISDLEFLISTTPNINDFTPDGETLLTWACENDAIIFVEKLLRNRLIKVDQKNSWGFAPLSIACRRNNATIARLLLDKYANVNILDHYGTTPIVTAYNNNALDIMELLLEYNANIYTDPSDDISLHRNVASIMETLHISLQPSYGFNLMHRACNENNVAVIDLLLAKCGDTYLHEYDEDLLYPLHYACINGAFDAASHLLQHGADPNVCSNLKFYPIEFASMTGSYDMVDLLVRHRANVNVFDKYFCTPLIYACMYGCDSISKLLIDNGANVNAYNSCEFTPLMYASMHGYNSISKLLIDNGANVNACNSFGFTPLMYASICKNLDLAQLLLRSNANIDQLNKFGNSALRIALSHNDVDLAELLISNVADVSFLTRTNDSELIQTLLKSNDTRVRVITSLHILDNKSLYDNLCLCQQQYGTTATVDFIKQIKSSPDYNFCQKLNRSFKNDLDKLIKSNDNLQTIIKSIDDPLCKLSYMEDKEICSTQISNTRKKLLDIRNLLRTIDDFVCTKEDLPKEMSMTKSLM